MLFWAFNIAVYFFVEDDYGFCFWAFSLVAGSSMAAKPPGQSLKFDPIPLFLIPQSPFSHEFSCGILEHLLSFVVHFLVFSSSTYFQISPPNTTVYSPLI